MYIMPRGSLAERLGAVASGAAAAAAAGAGLVVVWPDAGDADVNAAWTDIYAAPALPLGPFPSGRYSHADAGCAARHVAGAADFAAANATGWKKTGGTLILCLVATGRFVEDPAEAAAFYRALRPSPQVMALVAPFTEVQHWDRWGQWIGVHSCRSQDCVVAAASTGAALPAAADFLALARQISGMPLDGEAVPRFFIVSEDAAEEEAVQQGVWAMELVGLKGAGVTFPSRHRHAQPHSVAGLRETAAALHLLSRCAMVVGTPGSELSAAAAAAEGAFFVTAAPGNATAVGVVAGVGADPVRAALVQGGAAGQAATGWGVTAQAMG